MIDATRFGRRAVPLFAVLACAACESPILAGRPATDLYDFTLPSTPPAILRWPSGSAIDVYVAPSGDSDRDALLTAAASRGAAAWNVVALFGEYRLVLTNALEAADAVIAWSDAPLPVETADCRPALQRAVTTFCVSGLGTDSAYLEPFPLRPPAAPASGRVKMLVTMLGSEALVPDRVPLLVTHELGHVLGIGRHSPNPNDVMWAIEPQVAQPSRRDAATVQVLYHAHPDITP
jgi:hypothetical protein